MIKNKIVLLVSMVLFGCGNAPLIKVNWQGNLIKHSEEIDYLYWREGVQFSVQHKDSVAVSMAGFSHENYIYILAAIANETERPITFFPLESSLQFQSGKQKIELKPVKPKNLDKEHFSFFNTVLVGAGNISRLFINLPVDILIPDNKEEDPLSNIGQDYHDEDIRITKKIFISTHTLQPDDKFAGFLVFELDDDLEINDNQFTLKINFDDKEFLGNGGFDK